MDLLWYAVWPHGPDMIRDTLNTDAWFAVDAHHVPVVLGVDGALQYAGPEPALRRKLGGVEDDDLMTDPHVRLTPMIIDGRE